MKKIFITLSIIFNLMFFSCTSIKQNDVVTTENLPVQGTETESDDISEIEDIDIPEPETQPSEVSEEAIFIPEEIVEETEPSVPDAEPEQKKLNEEYERSTVNVSVSKDVFNDDKSRILNIIKSLDDCMKNSDYKTWISYLDDESIEYWSKKQNLQKAAGRLPKKGLKLRNLEDYFRFIFIPARAGYTVNEIRYETESHVKVVQATDSTDTVYYNFQKTGSQWKLVLPKNSD